MKKDFPFRLRENQICILTPIIQFLESLTLQTLIKCYHTNRYLGLFSLTHHSKCISVFKHCHVVDTRNSQRGVSKTLTSIQYIISRESKKSDLSCRLTITRILLLSKGNFLFSLRFYKFTFLFAILSNVCT